MLVLASSNISLLLKLVSFFYFQAFTEIPTVSLQSWTTQFWSLDMGPRTARTTGSSRTLGALRGEKKVGTLTFFCSYFRVNL